ncbi:hypothetical protein PMAYCL1PPCAC_00008, partial [Pristionchus mayeri]
ETDRERSSFSISSFVRDVVPHRVRPLHDFVRFCPTMERMDTGQRYMLRGVRHVWHSQDRPENLRIGDLCRRTRAKAGVRRKAVRIPEENLLRRLQEGNQSARVDLQVYSNVTAILRF